MTTVAFVGVGTALLAGTLLCAGVAKLTVPVHLGRAIRDLAPAVRGRAVSLARVVGAIEVGAALALSVPPLHSAGSAAGVVLGVVFAASGAAAAARGVRSPCGCFGRTGERPLGVRNVVFGLAVAAVSGWLFLDRSGGWATHPGLPVLGTGTVALVLAAWLYRDVIDDLLPLPGTHGRPRPTRSTR
jgi:hypothetical protein